VHGDAAQVPVSVSGLDVAVNAAAAVPPVAGVKLTVTWPVPGPAAALPMVGVPGAAAKAGAAPATIALAITAAAASKPPI
jgi:hypothetical protein